MSRILTELLAPAKDKETAFEAINAGADAIYIGAGQFGARKNASNNISDLKEIVEYAHKFYVKVFVTLNTILTDDELSKAKDLIKALYEINIDAIIVQDMGILEAAINKELPPIPIHMSTQCNNRTVEKVKFFEEMGLPRVILARELSLKQIKEITHSCPNTEIETFIHGALCVSYSGQCYLSQFIGGRSANRGECAQPCRKQYSLVNEHGEIIEDKKHLLCLKDFNASKHIEELVKIGVKSFKIEGRLKDTNYVKNIVLNYRQLLDKYSKKSSSGIIQTELTPNVNKTFNRGYTTYFLSGREKCFNFASPKSIGEEIGTIKKSCGKYYLINTAKKINPQDGLCYLSKDGNLRGFAVNKIEDKKIFPNTYTDIETGTKIYRNVDTEFEKELKTTKTSRKIRVDISVKNGYIKLIDENQNRIERELPQGEIANNKEKAKETFIKQLAKTGDSDFIVQNIRVNDEINFYPISMINEFRRELLEELMKERLANYRNKEQGELAYIPFPEETLDYRANVLNKAAEKFYKESLCEITEPAFEHTTPNRSNVELMRTKHCIKWALEKCQSPETLLLVDEKGVKYPLFFDCPNCEMAILKPEE